MLSSWNCIILYKSQHALSIFQPKGVFFKRSGSYEGSKKQSCEDVCWAAVPRSDERKKNSKTFIVHLLQGYPTLFLESYRPADFSSNPAPTHLSEINKHPWRPWLAGSGVFDWGWSWNLQDGISPGAGLETPDLLYDHSCCLTVL